MTSTAQDLLKHAGKGWAGEGIGEVFERLIKDTCEEEEQIRALAKQVIPAEVIDGDIYYVPSSLDIVELLVAEIQLRKRLAGEKS